MIMRTYCILASLGILAASISSCATKPEKIKPQYISSAMYAQYDCDQLRLEITRVNSRLSELCNEQRSDRKKDAAAVGVGLVLFWPSLFFLMGNDEKDEISRLKGEYEALQQQAIMEKCEYAGQLGIIEEPDPSPKKAEINNQSSSKHK